MMRIAKNRHIGLFGFLMFLLTLFFTESVGAQCSSIEPLSVTNIDELAIEERLFLQSFLISEILWSDDGTLLYVLGEQDDTDLDEIRIYDTGDFTRPPETISIDQAIAGLWALETGQLAIATSLGDFESEIPIKYLKFVPAYMDAIAPNGEFGVEAQKEIIQIIDLQSGELIKEFTTQYDTRCDFLCYVADVALSGDSRFLVYSTPTFDISSGIIDLDTDEINYDPEIGLYDLTFSTSGELIASARGTEGYVGRLGVMLNDTKTGERVAKIESFSNGITNPAFSPDGSLLVFGSVDENSPTGLLTIWDVEQLRQTGEGDTENAIFREYAAHTSLDRIAFHPSGGMIATAILLDEISQGSQILIWGIPANQTCNDG